MRDNRYARAALTRAKKLRAGIKLSPRETARILTNAAEAIEHLERELDKQSELRTEVAALRAYREGVRDGQRRDPHAPA